MAELNKRQRELLDRVIAALDAAGARPPRAKELGQELNVPIQAIQAIFEIGLEGGEIVRLSNGFHFATITLKRLGDEGRGRFGDAFFEVGEWRDFLDVSRGTAYAILEYLDGAGATEQVGGKRRLKPTE